MEVINAVVVVGIIGFVAVIVSIVAGFTTIKKNISLMTDLVIDSHVKMEHRFTVLETDLSWLKAHVPKRKSDT